MNKKEIIPGIIFYRLLVLAALCVVIYVRLRLAQAPLDRDEGEFAYAGQLALQGIPPYFLAYNMKFPGIYWVYALIMAAFGQTDVGIRAGFLLINLANAFLVFSIGSRVMNKKSGLAASAVFLIVMMTYGLDGLFACAENAVILFSFAGLRLLLYATDTGQKRLTALAGLLLGISIVVRQHGVFFFAAGLVYLLYAGRGSGLKNTLQNCLAYAAGSALPPALTAVYILHTGVAADFIFWVFTYGMKYVTSLDLKSAARLFSGFFGAIFSDIFPVLFFAIYGIAALSLYRPARKTAAILLSLMAFSFMAVSVGLYFRSHYFIYIMPAISLMCGAAVFYFERDGVRPAMKTASRALLVAAIAAVIFTGRGMWFEYTPDETTGYSYRENPFVDIKKISAFIRANTTVKDTVMVLGSEPELYFYSGRHSASGYIYMYPLMELHEYAGGMQERAIKQVEEARPEFIVYVNCGFSWSARTQSARLIFDWFEKYRKKLYDVTGTADMITPFQTEYRWGPASAGADYTKQGRITIFKRLPPPRT